MNVDSCLETSPNPQFKEAIYRAFPDARSTEMFTHLPLENVGILPLEYYMWGVYGPREVANSENGRAVILEPNILMLLPDIIRHRRYKDYNLLYPPIPKSFAIENGQQIMRVPPFIIHPSRAISDYKLAIKYLFNINKFWEANEGFDNKIKAVIALAYYSGVPLSAFGVKRRFPGSLIKGTYPSYVEIFSSIINDSDILDYIIYEWIKKFKLPKGFGLRFKGETGDAKSKWVVKTIVDIYNELENDIFAVNIPVGQVDEYVLTIHCTQGYLFYKRKEFDYVEYWKGRSYE